MIVYTDGSCSPNPGPGGWSFIIVDGAKVEKHWGSEEATSNNRMELTAAISAIRYTPKRCKLEIVTDSEYLKRGITEWIKKWQYNGWKTAAKKPVENRDLWQALLDVSDGRDIEWKWVKGHAGDNYNEEADKLATRAREEQSVGKQL